MIPLTAFISTSQVSVETKLDKVIEWLCQGRKEGFNISLQTVDSLSAGDKAAWRTIRNELEDIDISMTAFEVDRNFLTECFVRAVVTGAFDEQHERFIDEKRNYNGQQDLGSNGEQGGQDTEWQFEHTESESLGSISKDQPLTRPHSSGSGADTGPNLLERGSKTADQILASARTAPIQRRLVPHVADLLEEETPMQNVFPTHSVVDRFINTTLAGRRAWAPRRR